METKIKAAGYVRVSTAIQVAEGESLDTQKTQITDFVKQREKDGWELITIYSDEGATGTKIEYRTQFQQMINDAKEKKFDVIVFTKFSRFARNARDYQNCFHELKQYGVNLACVKENIDPTTRTGQMMAGMLALFAEWEHETIREQFYDNKMAKWRDNRTFIGVPPFGYQWNKATNMLKVNPTEAEFYLKIVNMYMEQRLSLRDIAIKLNDEGIVCVRIKKDGTERRRASWYSATISYLLKNPCYYGHYVVNRHKYEDSSRGAGTRRTKVRKPESESITFPIEAIISKLEWDRIQERTALNKIIPKHTGEHTMKFFLRNVLICDICGGKMNVRIGSKRKDGYVNRYYTCYWAGTSKKNLEKHRDHKCSLPYIPAEELEKKVWNRIMVMFQFGKKSFKDLFDPKKYEQEIDGLVQTALRFESDLKMKNTARERLYELLEKPKCDVNEVNKRLQKNEDDRLTIKGHLDKIKQRINDRRSWQERESESLKFFADNKSKFSALYREIGSLDLADRKRLIEALLPEPIRVHYQDLNPEYPEDGYGVVADFKIQFNIEIFKRFIDEGKIKQLNINSKHYHAASHP